MDNFFDPTVLDRSWYETALNDCLQNQVADQTANRKKIAVVGAGISGLVSAWMLAKAGHSVRLLEASNVPGGRIKTLRHPFTSDFYAEAGAMRIPDNHNLTKRILKDALKFSDNEDENEDSDLITFSHEDPKNVLFFNNFHTTRGEYKVDPEDFDYSKLNTNEMRRQADCIFQECVMNYIDYSIERNNVATRWREFLEKKDHNPKGLFNLIGNDSSSDLKNWNKALMSHMDEISFRRFLKENCYLDRNTLGKNAPRISEDAATIIASVLVYDMHFPSSMAAILGDYSELTQNKYWQIANGMDRLPKDLAKLLLLLPNVKIDYNCRVRKMRCTGENATIDVEYENPISRVQSILHQQDAVIIALPFSALRHINMTNLNMTHLMSTDKRRAVRQLHYDNSCKILIEFSNRFWETECGILSGGSSITDLPVRQIHYPSPRQNRGKDGKGLLLASYTWGEDSLRWTSLKDDDRIRFALDNLERVHPTARGLHKLCSGGFSHSWAEHEFTSGAFAMFEPFQMNDLFPHIWKPEGRLHYCGEHTSTKHGWIEGAIESGLRVAREVMARVSYTQGFSTRNTKPAAPII